MQSWHSPRAQDSGSNLEWEIDDPQWKRNSSARLIGWNEVCALTIKSEEQLIKQKSQTVDSSNYSTCKVCWKAGKLDNRSLILRVNTFTDQNHRISTSQNNGGNKVWLIDQTNRSNAECQTRRIRRMSTKPYEHRLTKTAPVHWWGHHD